MAFRGRITLWKSLLNENVSDAVRLLEGGADATELHDGKTPMQFFCENKKVAKPELFDALLKFGGVVDDTCLYRACFKDNVNAVRILLQAKRDGRIHFNANIIHPARNDTPLFVAVRNENPAICQLLLNDSDVDPNIRVLDEFTALYYAVSENLFDIVDLLLQNPRTDPNIQFQDKTPLHVAAVRNNARVISMLVLHPRINPYIRDRFEATPLDIAKVRRNKDTIALLERFPASPLPTPPLTTALIVHNYAVIPNATDFEEFDEKPVSEFDHTYMVFKIGDSFFALPKESVRKNIEDIDGDRILFECMGELHGAPRLDQIHANQKYFVLSGTGNYVIPLEHILGALVHPTNVFEITGPVRRLDNVASYSSVMVEGERGFKHRLVNIVSRDHCQGGTDKQIYELHPLQVVVAPAVPAAAPVAPVAPVANVAAPNARRGGARRMTRRRRRRSIRRCRSHKSRYNN